MHLDVIPYWAFPEISGSPLLRITEIPGGLKNENLENFRGLCLNLENARGVIIEDNGFPWTSRGVREKMVWNSRGV